MFDCVKSRKKKNEKFQNLSKSNIFTLYFYLKFSSQSHFFFFHFTQPNSTKTDHALAWLRAATKKGYGQFISNGDQGHFTIDSIFSFHQSIILCPPPVSKFFDISWHHPYHTILDIPTKSQHKCFQINIWKTLISFIRKNKVLIINIIFIAKEFI